MKLQEFGWLIDSMQMVYLCHDATGTERLSSYENTARYAAIISGNDHRQYGGFPYHFICECGKS